MEGSEAKPLGHVIEGEESEEEEEVDESDGELTEEIRVKTAAAGLVFEGEDDEEEEEPEDEEERSTQGTKTAGADEGVDDGSEIQMVADDRRGSDASGGIEALHDSVNTSASGDKPSAAPYTTLGAFSDAIAPLLKTTRKKGLIQEQSAAERKIQRHNQGIRTTINAKLHQTFQSTHKDVMQVSHQLDLVRNVTQDLNIKVHAINDDLEKLTATIDKTCGSFLQLLQPSLQGRTMHT